MKGRVKEGAVVWSLGLVLLAAGGEVEAQGVPVPETCTACHLTLDEEHLRRPAELFSGDLHAQAGFGCLECHGDPGRVGAPDPASGFLSVPAKEEIPGLCGRCHSNPEFMRDYAPSLRVDQVTEYYTSVHGKRLRELGDPDVATCVDCHPAHQIRPPSDPESPVYATNVAETCASCHADTVLMAGHDVETNQFEIYRESVHGRMMFDEGDVSSPTCNDCHGNHGAAPPGVASVQRVCGQCHATQDELFTENGHDEYFVQKGLSGCNACHGHHDVQRPTDRDLIRKNEEVCRSCHVLGTPYAFEFPAMAYFIDSLQVDRDWADSILDRAANLGMEVSQAQFELQDVATALTRSRTAIHAFVLEPVREEVEAGLQVTSRAGARGQEALEEHTFRRMGLAASVTIIFVLIFSLGLKIRQIERSTIGKHPGDTSANGARTPTQG